MPDKERARDPQDWKTRMEEMRANIHGLHDAIESYLKLTDNPSEIAEEDLKTVVQMSGEFPGVRTEEGLDEILAEFMPYYGYSSIDDEHGRTIFRRNSH